MSAEFLCILELRERMFVYYLEKILFLTFCLSLIAGFSVHVINLPFPLCKIDLKFAFWVQVA